MPASAWVALLRHARCFPFRVRASPAPGALSRHARWEWGAGDHELTRCGPQQLPAERCLTRTPAPDSPDGGQDAGQASGFTDPRESRNKATRTPPLAEAPQTSCCLSTVVTCHPSLLSAIQGHHSVLHIS